MVDINVDHLSLEELKARYINSLKRMTTVSKENRKISQQRQDAWISLGDYADRALFAERRMLEMEKAIKTAISIAQDMQRHFQSEYGSGDIEKVLTQALPQVE